MHGVGAFNTLFSAFYVLLVTVIDWESKNYDTKQTLSESAAHGESLLILP